MDHNSWKAIQLVEWDIPLYKRHAAVTSSHSFVAGLGQYFELAWTFETLEEDLFGA